MIEMQEQDDKEAAISQFPHSDNKLLFVELPCDLMPIAAWHWKTSSTKAM